jgi:hypothetical protein
VPDIASIALTIRFDKDLLQLDAVTPNGRKPVGEPDPQGHIVASCLVLRERHHFMNGLVYVQPVLPWRLGLQQGPDTPDDLPGTLAVADDALERALRLRGPID